VVNGEMPFCAAISPPASITHPVPSQLARNTCTLARELGSTQLAGGHAIIMTYVTHPHGFHLLSNPLSLATSKSMEAVLRLAQSVAYCQITEPPV
jgi:hypothetical protein